MYLKCEYDGNVTYHPLIEGEKVSVGRSNKADIIIPVGNISRVHVQLRVGEDRLYVTDENSKNGVFINNKKVGVESEGEVLFGDILNLGGDVHLSLTERKQATQINALSDLKRSSNHDETMVLTRTNIKGLLDEDGTPLESESKRRPRKRRSEEKKEKIPVRSLRYIEFVVVGVVLLIAVNYLLLNDKKQKVEIKTPVARPAQQQVKTKLVTIRKSTPQKSDQADIDQKVVIKDKCLFPKENYFCERMNKTRGLKGYEGAFISKKKLTVVLEFNHSLNFYNNFLLGDQLTQEFVNDYKIFSKTAIEPSKINNQGKRLLPYGTDGKLRLLSEFLNFQFKLSDFSEVESVILVLYDKDRGKRPQAWLNLDSGLLSKVIPSQVLKKYGIYYLKASFKQPMLTELRDRYQLRL